MRLYYILLAFLPLYISTQPLFTRQVPFSFEKRIPYENRYKKKKYIDYDGTTREMMTRKKDKHPWLKVAWYGFLCGTCGWLAWKNRFDIITVILGGEFFLNQSVFVGNALCKGHKIRVNENVTVQQLKVARQSGASCGYHALHRCLQIMRALVNNDANLGQKLGDVQGINNVIHSGDQDGDWRALIKSHREHLINEGNDNGDGNKSWFKHGSWLNDGEIEKLCQDQKTGDLFGNNVNVNDISVCGNPNLLGNGNGFDHVIPAVREKIDQQQPFVHGIILGNMQQYGNSGGSSGHWIAIVLRQNDQQQREYIVVDSMNGTLWRDDPRVGKLLRVLEGDDEARAFGEQAKKEWY